jgi:protein involved in polysaccharide export with SLBB domain
MPRAYVRVVVGAVLAALAAGTVAAQERERRDTEMQPVEPELQEPAPPRSLPPLETLPLRAGRYASVEALETAIDPQTYVLGPHDVLAVMVFLGQVRTERLPVLPEGVVLVPGVGSVPAAGTTLAQFREALRREFARRYRNFELYCYLAEARQFRVHVTGEVREPGTLVARSYERVSEVVERAGGFTDAASRRSIELRDAAGEVRRRADLDAYYLRGELAANPLLEPGLLVFVPPRRRSVEVVGAVAVPGTYEMLPGENLRDLVALAGGPVPQADLSRVSIDRIDAGGRVRVERYDLTVEAPSLDDVARVAVASSLLGKRRAFVILPDGRRETLYLADGETLGSFVARVAQLEPGTVSQTGLLVSRDATGAAVERQVDLAGAGADGWPLQDGDVFSIAAVKDYVYVSGMVARPGRFAYRADWVVGDYLGEAGGTAAGGNRDHVTLLDTAGEPRSAGRDDRVERGETIHVNRSTGSKIATALGIVTTISALVISIVALTR